jgi:subtilisin-like proprotein convertase family protein
MVVANGQDAEINADGTLNSVLRNSSSSEGPTDDLRIKPDIMGNGTQLYSTYDGADDEYNSITGTSMASPNVTGSLLLLQQYYNESYGNFMRASTLKGLALHTADNVGEAGPDALTGWGLMNTKKAAETITKKGLQSVISEIELTQGSTYSIVVNSDGLSPLLASISWTDLPGQVSVGTENDPTPALVNDLDIRVVKNSATPTTFMPWKLTSVNTNEKEDNTVDPFERVDVEDASGEYTVTISHKGSLQGGLQKVSLIVTGVSSGIALLTNENSKITCNETEEFNFSFIETIGGVTSFSVDGLPANATVNLSEDSLDSDGTLVVTFGDLDKVTSGTYSININGQNGSETTTTPIELRVINDSFADSSNQIVSPPTGVSGYSTNGTVISWENDPNAESYLIEVSDSPSFETILFTETSFDTSYTPLGLESESIYYWRIKPKNSCASGDYSSTYSFQTGTSNCSNVYDATDFSMAAIDTIPNQISPFVPFNVTQKVIVDKVLVSTNITHTWVADMVIRLEGPSSIGSTRVVLLSDSCGEGDDINATFDDSANALNCSSSVPAISGPIAPLNNMSLPFSGKDGSGEWKLIVDDSYNGDGGQINSASITICTLETNTNIPTFAHSDIIVEQNSTYSITESDMLATTESESSRFQVYTLVTVPAIGHLEKGGIVLTIGDTFNQKEVSGGSIKYVNSTPIAFIDEFKVDITNQANGWLSNQTVNIRESSALSLSKNSLEGFSLWPNPVKNQVKIQFTNSNMNNVRISLFDLQGREILHSIEESKTNTYSKEINVQNVASGIYLLKVQQGNKTITKKILVSK